MFYLYFWVLVCIIVIHQSILTTSWTMWNDGLKLFGNHVITRNEHVHGNAFIIFTLSYFTNLFRILFCTRCIYKIYIKRYKILATFINNGSAEAIFLQIYVFRFTRQKQKQTLHERSKNLKTAGQDCPCLFWVSKFLRTVSNEFSIYISLYSLL